MRNVIDTWKEIGGLEDVVCELEKAIMIGGYEEEQQFLLIPPTDAEQEWKYWKFAMWILGEQEFTDLKSYMESIIAFLNEQINENQYNAQS